VSGGTASGKKTVCDMIIQQLHDHRVVLVNQVRIFFSLSDYIFLRVRLWSWTAATPIEMFMYRTTSTTFECFIYLIDSEKSVLVPLSVVQTSCSILESQWLVCQTSPALSFALLPLSSAVLKRA
jgi:hypothetical protein